ncbi:MAG: amidohydrolase family protein [archaeon]
MITKAVVASKLIDATQILEKPIILIKNNKITEVGQIGQIDIPKHAEIIEEPDSTILPGLVDCHVHFTGSEESKPGLIREEYETRLINAATNQTKQLLNAGITSVMDTGGLIGLYVRDAVEKGIVEGPRIMAAGRYLSPTGGHGDNQSLPLEWVKEGRPFGWGMDGRLADGVPECMKATREQLRSRVDFIKIVTGGGGGSEIDPAWIPEYTQKEIGAITDIAHDWGRKVMAHCYFPESIRRTVNSGVDIVTHGNRADDETIKLMKEKGTQIVPTMSVYERIHELRPESKASEMYDTIFTNIRKLYDAGLTLAVGTDTMGGIFPFGGSALELELYVEKVGLSPFEALTIGTLNGVKVMGRDDKLGTIESGKYADLVMIQDDPLEDIKCLQDKDKIKYVLKNGKAVKNTL